MSLQLQYGSNASSPLGEQTSSAFWQAWQGTQNPFPTEPEAVTEAKEKGGFWQGIGADTVFGFLLEAGELARDIVTGSSGSPPAGYVPPPAPPAEDRSLLWVALGIGGLVLVAVIVKLLWKN